MKKNKFRVWDKVDAEFADYDEIYIDQEGEIYFIEERSQAYQTYMHKENISETVVIVQFTGLVDKNGKEIYEGDILKVPDLYETPENTYPTYHYEKVIYENHGFGTDNAMFYEDGDYISEECEVVGNIYENPELLEKVK